jgi:hypothetical protein
MIKTQRTTLFFPWNALISTVAGAPRQRHAFVLKGEASTYMGITFSVLWPTLALLRPDTLPYVHLKRGGG